MSPALGGQSGRPLLAQLQWFIRLRWLAGGAVVLGALVDRQWLGWFPDRDIEMLSLGVGIAAYNALLWLLLRRVGGRPAPRLLQALAMIQILLDLGCLTALTMWSGGVFSPLIGFFVFHMVFASLLLPRLTAYGGAAAAVAMLLGAMALTGPLPAARNERLMLAGWATMLLLTVYLSNRITRSLRRQRRRLVQRNRRIRVISSRLRQQQAAMIQHEKMVALGQMAAGVAHEIANPLASMDSLLQWLQRHPDRPLTDSLATLREQIHRIEQIIRQMTTFAHPTGSSWERVDLSRVVERALDMVRMDRRFGQTNVQRQYAPGGCQATVQQHAIEQVLVNLLLNALDAMEGQDDARLVLRTARENGASVIQVTDSGHGISPAHAAHIFEPFFTTKPVGKGTGLGLSISYSLVRQQGGEIKVTSEPGKGATFTVVLPDETAKPPKAELPR